MNKTAEGLFQVRVQLPSNLNKMEHPPGIEWSWTGSDSPAVALALSERRSVEVLFWRTSQAVTETINSLFTLASEQLSCPYPHEAIGIVITEMVQNALKANFKRCFFRKEKIDLHDPGAYENALGVFKEHLSKNTEDLAAMAVMRNLYVRVRITACRGNCIRIQVINNSPLLPVEAERIQQKLSASVHYSNIMDFLMEHQDETEGAGLGMLVITLSLKELGLSPDAFTVFEEENRRTVASLYLRW